MTADDSISMKCTCGKSLKVRSTAAGRAVKCAACGTAVRIPAAQSVESGDKPGEDVSAGKPTRLSEPASDVHPEPAHGTPVTDSSESPANTPENSGRANLTDGDYGYPMKHSAKPLVPDQRSYPVLKFLAGLFRVLACLTVIAAAAFVYNTKPDMDLDQWDDQVVGGWVLGSFGLGIAAATIAGLLVMSAELIQLAIHIQDNTLAAVHMVNRQRQSE